MLNKDQLLNIIKEAFKDGWNSKATYNDEAVVDLEEEWETMRCYYMAKIEKGLI